MVNSQRAGSMVAIFSGRLVRTSQSRWGVASIVAHRRVRAASTASHALSGMVFRPSNTSANDEQNTFRRIPLALAWSFHLWGSVS